MDDLPLELSIGPFAVHEATELGISRHRLRRSDLISPFRGVRMASSSAHDFEELCRAYAARMPPGHYFSHSSAARLWGMRIPERMSVDPIEVTAVPPARAAQARGVRSHTAKAGAATVLRGLPLSSPVTTWMSLAGRLSDDELIVAGDGLVRRRYPLATLEEIAAAVRCGNGVTARRLARALTQMRAGTDSRRETELRLILVRAGLPEPEVNLEISPPGAKKKRFGDLVYARWGVVVEYDGDHHRSSRATYADDVDRAEELRHLRFVHVIKEHWGDPGQIARRVEAALRECGWRGSRLPPPTSRG